MSRSAPALPAAFLDRPIAHRAFHGAGRPENSLSAVRAAVDAGDLDPERLARWRKLEAEDRHNSESLAEGRARGKSFTKHVKSTQRGARRRKGG